MSEVSRLETTRTLLGMPLFAGLTKRQLTSIAKAVDHASFEPGAQFVTEHEEAACRRGPVVAETPLDALLLYRTRFKTLLAAMPDLYPRLLVGMAARIRAIDRRDDIIG